MIKNNAWQFKVYRFIDNRLNNGLNPPHKEWTYGRHKLEYLVKKDRY